MQIAAVALVFSCFTLLAFPQKTTRAPGKENKTLQQILPYEPKADAELLAASHLFTIGVMQVSATEWSRKADGYEHRTIEIYAQLREVFKGSLRLTRGDGFWLKVPQRREDALTVSEFHGFWSHKEVEKGQLYLVISNGESTDPSVLMQEPAIGDVLPGAQSENVKLAIAAEGKFGQIESPKEATQLLEYTFEHRTEASGLFGRYAWERIRPNYAEAEDVILSLVMRTIRNTQSTLGMREAFLNGLYTEIFSLGPTPERCRSVLSPLLQLLTQDDAAPMVDRLLQVQIYNLVFRPGVTPPRASDILPDSGDRSRAAEIAARYRNSKSTEIANWLNQ